MRLIALSHLKEFWVEHPGTKSSLKRWAELIDRGTWLNTSEIQNSFARAKVLNRERVRFEISGGDYRLIVAFKFKNQIAFVKFIGTHAEYDRINAMSVSLF